MNVDKTYEKRQPMSYCLLVICNIHTKLGNRTLAALWVVVFSKDISQSQRYILINV